MSDKEKSSGVRREWRVLYKDGSAGASPHLFSIDVVALTAAAARAKVEAGGVRVVDVEEIRALIDPAKRWLTMEEAALRTGKAVRTISRWVELAILPKCDGGLPMWTVETVDRAAAKSVGLKLEAQSGELKAA